MKLQAIYDRLQSDVKREYGASVPRLVCSRAPIYEGCWKSLLQCIEGLGTNKPLTCIRMLPSVPEQRLTGVIQVLIVCEDGVRRELNTVPEELVELVEAFLLSRSARMLRCLRQICLLTYKSKSHEVTEEQVSNAVSGFISRNTSCQELSFTHYQRLAGGGDDTAQTLKIARLLCGIVMDRVDWREIRPSHGPGAVADAKRGIDKWKKLDSRTTRLCDKLYPLAEYFVPTPDSFNSEFASYVPSVCKLAVVPKDKRGPRIICTQPVGLMWVQKGQQRAIQGAIESSQVTHHNNRIVSDIDSSCSIKFDKQEQNGGLALESSRTREFATIDLSDASDLVSWGLVRYLLNKENVRFLAASRPMYVQIPPVKGESFKPGYPVKLHMFAPMGSAVCFPVESLVFWAIAAAATLVHRSVTYEEIVRYKAASRWLSNNKNQVFVFGDDIVVRRETCEFVCECLTRVGFKPNRSKTFIEGFYRESCGVDAYRGERLDIARLQYNDITSMPEAYASIEFAKRARGLGLTDCADYMEAQVESYLGFGLPFGVRGGCVWQRNWPCGQYSAWLAHDWNLRYARKVRYSEDLQTYVGWSVIARPYLDKVPQDDRCRLFRGLTVGVDEHAVDWLRPDNLQYSLGWVALY